MIVSVAFVQKSFRPVLVTLLQYLCLFALLPFAHSSVGSHQPAYEDELLPDAIITLRGENRPRYAIVVEKETQKLMLYEGGSVLRKKYSFPCSTGQGNGKKKRSGDRKTPEGVYFFTKAFKKRELSPIYGNRAFVIDYPNFIDNKSKRDGNNIWLHGSNKPIKPRNSNGCVVMNNSDLEKVAKYIRLNETPIIITQKLNMVRSQDQIADCRSLVDFLEKWKAAFVSGDRSRYRACYTEPLTVQDLLWKTWDELRPRWEQDHVSFNLTLENISLLRANPYVVAIFDEVIHMDHHVRNVGTKKLFIARDGETWKILGEVYQSAKPDRIPGSLLAKAITSMDRLYRDRKSIAELVGKWVDAWSSKDIDRYRRCYAKDFHARGMDLDAWISYKNRLNRRYSSIEVAVEDLRIRQRSDRATATFLQRYRSSGYRSVGMKTLYLKRIGGTWKIHREKWYETRQ